ncbi:MAG: oligosaccharide flippase family protein [Acinetobacter sp.]|uniref:oligosaccharide flippase family protein n=1 Tax=Acinetobacter sp. TaxID=472 RepID=UPI0026DF52AE|nr:oligosaccharide flippase family protein [Acinetobacter sp.]MDO5542826.1 oligosaccharide flippase family protein [Acinetobacter sp.]
MSIYHSNRTIFINTMWSFIGRFGSLLISLITNIILVRLLSPQEFGQVGIIMFFVVISSILVESGLGGALVRQEHTSEVDYSTVFIFNLSISIIMALGIFISAETIAVYYNDSELIFLLKLASLVLIFNALRVTQTVKLIRSLKFKEKSLYETIAFSIAALTSIYTAVQGYGPVALVILELVNTVILTVLFWYFVGPLNKIKFSSSSFFKFYKFGFNTTLASLLNQVFDNIYHLVLAKYFSIQQAGYFYQAKKIQGLPLGVIQGSVLNVVYSALSRLQNNAIEFNKLYYNIVKIFTIGVSFLCIIIFLYADAIINILYGSEWSQSVFYLKILIIAAFFSLQELLVGLIFKVFDRTDMILKLEIFKKLLLSITIFYGIWVSNVDYLFYGFVLISIWGFLINYYYARKIQTSIFLGGVVIMKIILISMLMVVIVTFFKESYEVGRGGEFLMFPIIFLSYILALFVIGVVSLDEVKMIKKIFR